MDIRTCSRMKSRSKSLRGEARVFAPPATTIISGRKIPLPPEKLVYRQTNPLIEAAQHGGIGDVRLRRRIEMENLVHERVPTPRFYSLAAPSSFQSGELSGRVRLRNPNRHR